MESKWWVELLLTLVLNICVIFFLITDVWKWKINSQGNYLIDRENDIGRPYILTSREGSRFPRTRGRRHFPRMVALLLVRGFKSPSHGASQQIPWCFSSKPSLLSRRGSRVVAGHNTLCLPKAVSGRLVLARVKLLENQLLLRYCLWRALRARDAPLARSPRLSLLPLTSSNVILCRLNIYTSFSSH